MINYTPHPGNKKGMGLFLPLSNLNMKLRTATKYREGAVQDLHLTLVSRK